MLSRKPELSKNTKLLIVYYIYINIGISWLQKKWIYER